MKKSKVSSLLFCCGILALLDSVIGGIAALGLDWWIVSEIALGISFVLGFPAFMVDVLLGRRVPLVMTIDFVLRWLIRCYDGKRFVLCNPFVWPVGLMLASAIFVFVLNTYWQDHNFERFA